MTGEGSEAVSGQRTNSGGDRWRNKEARVSFVLQLPYNSVGRKSRERREVKCEKRSWNE